MNTPPHITPKQAQWFETVRKGLEADTGKSLEEWIAIARTCPEKKHKARLAWFKDVHGLGVNRASTILGAAFETGLGWDQPDALLDHLWKTTESRRIYDALASIMLKLGDDVVAGPRKSFSGFSRKYQFAAARPVRDGVRLGLAVPFEITTGCETPKSSDSWSDRLKSVRVLRGISDVNEDIEGLLWQAYDAS